MSDQNDTSFLERRQFVRLQKQFVVRVTEAVSSPCHDARAHSMEMAVTNISLGGIALETETPYPAGAALSLDILLPEPETREPAAEGVAPSEDARLLHVQCNVVWCSPTANRKFATGLRFINLDERQFEALSQLIARDV